MSKTKCETCATTHGGFHLCLGRRVNISAEQHEIRQVDQDRASTRMTARWEEYRAKNLERDQGILKMYEEGSSLQTVGDAYGLSNPSVKSIVIRMGGKMRPRNSNAS